MKKDIDWLKKEIEEVLYSAHLRGEHTAMQSNVMYDDIVNKIDHLDEPEVLSREWIEGNSVYASSDGVTEEYVHVDDLQNLLVPKQELPVIPKFVAEWIEEVKPDNSLRVAFEYIAQRKRDNHDDELAFWVEEGNSETFVRAWLDGYTVGEEQKYYVIFKQEDTCTVTLNKNGGIGTIFRTGSEIPKSHQLTEQEIKDYDERFWPFAVKVEELEE